MNDDSRTGRSYIPMFQHVNVPLCLVGVLGNAIVQLNRLEFGVVSISNVLYDTRFHIMDSWS